MEKEEEEKNTQNKHLRGTKAEKRKTWIRRRLSKNYYQGKKGDQKKRCSRQLFYSLTQTVLQGSTLEAFKKRKRKKKE